MKKLSIILTALFILAACEVNKEPLEDPVIAVERITLDITEVELIAGETVQLTAVIEPQDAEYELLWNTASQSVATVDETGLVTAMDEGTTIITAMAGMETATCTVTVSLPASSQEGDYVDEYGINHGQGVEIDGIVWAPVNCGYHATDFQYGKLYQWGRKYGQGYDGDLWNAGETPTYSDTYAPTVAEGPVSVSEGNDPANADVYFTGQLFVYYDWTDPQDETLWNSGSQESPVRTENDPCPEGWRVPTYTELETLSANYSAWTKENGQNGFWFTGSAAYSSELPQIFLSASGQIGYEGNASDRGRYGNYWSSRATPAPDRYYSNALFFYSDAINMTYNFGRAVAFSVRCVQVTD